MNDLISAVNQQDAIIGMVEAPDRQHIGYVFRMGYENALVMTNDAWRDRVGGIPLGCILVASEIDFDEPGRVNVATASAVVLRVTGPARLPQDDDAMRTLIEMHQRRRERRRPDEHDGMDGMTHAQLQWGGLECRILGTMFKRDGQLALGADIEDFPSAVQYRVYKPIKSGLSSIVNFVDPLRLQKASEEARALGFRTLPASVEIGTLRYTSANLRHKGSDAEVVIKIQPFDLLARRTAVFGMTRTGKSNTTKTLVSEIALAAARGGQPVGQLIFDMNGEYANANHQDDGSSLADAFGGDDAGMVIRYRGREADGFRDLRLNFYEDFTVALPMMQGLVGGDPSSGSSQEFQTFRSLAIPEPEQNDHRARRRYDVKRAIFHTLLARANFPADPAFRIRFIASQDVVDTVGAALKPNGTPAEFLEAAGGRVVPRVGIECAMTPDQAVAWFIAAWDVKQNLRSSTGQPWLDSDAVILIDVMASKSTARNGAPIVGHRVIERQRAYHSARGSGDVSAEIYRELAAGRIVILDLSVGIESMREAMAERIAKHVLESSMEALHGGGVPPNMVLYVEEAHNLIGADAEPDETWPRIAKEGAKARIALVYATQEPSSVQRNILSNTENIFCTHLNNDQEVQTLSKYYDFADFAQSIKKAQDVGFARMKTLSAPFVIPTQIRKFEPHKVKELWQQARAAAPLRRR